MFFIHNLVINNHSKLPLVNVFIEVKMSNESEVEGTPLLGPLPLELQQIKAQSASRAALIPNQPATRFLEFLLKWIFKDVYKKYS